MVPNWDKVYFISVYIPLIYEHIFYKICPSICRSGYKRQQCKNVFSTPISIFLFSLVHTYFFKFETASLLMDVVIFVIYTTYCSKKKQFKIWNLKLLLLSVIRLCHNFQNCGPLRRGWKFDIDNLLHRGLWMVIQPVLICYFLLSWDQIQIVNTTHVTGQL